MNRTRPLRPIRRLATALAALAGALLAISTGSRAAFAYVLPPGPSSGGAAGSLPVQTVVVGGMPGWQIALIAVAAAVVAAAIVVLLDRARATRRHQAAPSA